VPDFRYPIFPDVYLPHLREVTLPKVLPVSLEHFKSPPLAEPLEVLRRELESARRLSALAPGSRVGVAVGSRGIAALPEVVAGVVAWLKEKGHEPVLIPAMGSHGGAHAETQAQILRDLGMSEEEMGAPILSSMEVVLLGTTHQGVSCYFSRDALEMDAVVVVNRVKSHTSFDRPIESGLTKMVAVGLGKAQGARFVHRLGPVGLRDVLPELARISIAKAPIAFGVAVVENADKELIHLEGVEPEAFGSADERLLVVAKQNLARLPFEQIDVLVVERFGKDISGMGMDYAVVGRTDIRGLPNPGKPFIHKIVALEVTEASHGNAQGIGIADYIPKRVVESLDLVDLYTNAITAAVIEKSRIPPVLPDDREAIRAAVATAWRLTEEDVRLCIISSTLHLKTILVSEALARDLDSIEGAQVVGEAREIEFSEDGTLATRCPV
jgi:hypothetical protein